jgi:hypothetical protein
MAVRNRGEPRTKFGTQSLTIVLTVDQRKIHRVLYRPPFGVSDSDGRPRTPERPGPDVAEQSASGNRPDRQSKRRFPPETDPATTAPSK